MTKNTKIAAAVGTASAGKSGSVSGLEIEAVMSKAVLDAAAEGITDPDEIRRRKLAARAALLGKPAPGGKSK